MSVHRIQRRGLVQIPPRDGDYPFIYRRGFKPAAADISRIIEMAWEDRTPFEAIEHQYRLNEAQVIRLMRRELKPGSFRLWRQRVGGRKTKHRALRNPRVLRAHAPGQYKR